MHACNGVLTVLGLAHFCVSIKVKLTIPLLCVWVHSAWKGHPRNDLYCAGWDVKSYSLIHFTFTLIFFPVFCSFPTFAS